MAKNNLNKTEMHHLKQRVENTVKCTNGEIATRMNEFKKGTYLTDKRKFNMIKSGKAILKEEQVLVHDVKGRYSSSGFKCLLDCYDYPETDQQAENIAHNKMVERKKEALMHEVTLEGERLIDRVVLGITELKDIPGELHKLGSMVTIANNVNKGTFDVNKQG